MEIVSNVRVGEPDINPSAPAHTPGVREGNQPPRLGREPGWRKVLGRGQMRLATPRRSTGINPEARRPIDPRMPVLTPA